MTNEISEVQIRNSFREQAALTQLHRWISYWPDRSEHWDRIDDLVIEDIELALSDGSAVAGKSDLKALNRHDHQFEFSAIAGKEYEMIGEPDQNFEIRLPVFCPEAEPDSQFGDVRLSFDWADQLQPKIASVKYHIAATGRETQKAINPMASRLMSVNHRWHVLVEYPGRTPDPFQEIIGDEFVMDYGHGAVRSYEELCTWVAGSASSVDASRHDMESFESKQLDDGRYQAVFVLDWNGLTHEGKRMTAQTEHVWTIRDVPSARFPLIDHIKVNFLQPFKVIN